jgi:hypothetical protein
MVIGFISDGVYRFWFASKCLGRLLGIRLMNRKVQLNKWNFKEKEIRYKKNDGVEKRDDYMRNNEDDR